jgi:hypothetical protein
VQVIDSLPVRSIPSLILILTAPVVEASRVIYSFLTSQVALIDLIPTLEVPLYNSTVVEMSLALVRFEESTTTKSKSLVRFILYCF